MTHALSEQQPEQPAAAVTLSPAAARLARLVELTRLLETVAHLAASRHGALYLLVDRSGSADTVDIKALVDDDRLVDLWHLNPLLWDDAHWAAVRLLEVGEVRIVRPRLHQD